jgi:hypothetical protein
MLRLFFLTSTRYSANILTWLPNLSRAPHANVTQSPASLLARIAGSFSDVKTAALREPQRLLPWV